MGNLIEAFLAIAGIVAGFWTFAMFLMAGESTNQAGSSVSTGQPFAIHPSHETMAA